MEFYSFVNIMEFELLFNDLTQLTLPIRKQHSLLYVISCMCNAVCVLKHFIFFLSLPSYSFVILLSCEENTHLDNLTNQRVANVPVEGHTNIQVKASLQNNFNS